MKLTPMKSLFFGGALVLFVGMVCGETPPMGGLLPVGNATAKNKATPSPKPGARKNNPKLTDLTKDSPISSAVQMVYDMIKEEGKNLGFESSDEDDELDFILPAATILAYAASMMRQATMAALQSGMHGAIRGGSELYNLYLKDRMEDLLNGGAERIVTRLRSASGPVSGAALNALQQYVPVEDLLNGEVDLAALRSSLRNGATAVGQNLGSMASTLGSAVTARGGTAEMLAGLIYAAIMSAGFGGDAGSVRNMSLGLLGNLGYGTGMRVGGPLSALVLGSMGSLAGVGREFPAASAQFVLNKLPPAFELGMKYGMSAASKMADVGRMGLEMIPNNLGNLNTINFALRR